MATALSRRSWHRPTRPRQRPMTPPLARPRGRRRATAGVGESAAANAEDAFAKAVRAWNGGDRSSAMYWLGAALHLVQDACVPQHNFFGIGVFHSDYEHWAREHQDQLAIASGGIYRGDFRATRGHGGASWSSRHPRGWVDECAQRSAAELAGATHPNPSASSSADPQWVTAPLIEDVQRISAGFITFFFEEVGGP